KILHPATIAPCQRSNIPVAIASTFDHLSPCTYITPDKVSNASLVRGISLRKKQILVTVRSLQMLDCHGFLAKLFSILATYRISVDLITTSEVSVALTVDGTNFGSLGINPFENPELMNELLEICEVTIEDDLTLVALV